MLFLGTLHPEEYKLLVGWNRGNTTSGAQFGVIASEQAHVGIADNVKTRYNITAHYSNVAYTCASYITDFFCQDGFTTTIGRTTKYSYANYSEP